VGPQPDKPIRPPEGYTGEPPAEPGSPPQPKPAAPPAAAPEEAKAPAPAPTAPPPAAPEPVKCPGDATSLINAKVKANLKDKKKRAKLELTAKSGVTFKKLVKTEDGAADDVKADGDAFSAVVAPKTKLVVLVQCGWEDRTISVTVDGAHAALREIPAPPEPGFLNLAAEPGLKVSANGKELGVTPLRNVPLAPGKYQLKLQPAKGKPRTVAVEIKSSATATVSDIPKKK
jgi:hypothetical protein